MTIQNTWDMIYDDVIVDDFSENSSDSDGELDDLDCRSDMEGRYEKWQDCGSSAASAIDRLFRSAPGLRADGTRRVGSPLARALPPSRLGPPISKAELSSHEMVSGVAIDEWYSVVQVFNLLVQLLTSTEKRPRVFRFPGNVSGAESLSPTLLDSDKSTPAFSFLNLSVNLKTLHLKLASLERGATIELAPDLPLLKTFFKTSMSLTTLTLVLPIEWKQDHGDSEKGHSLYNFTQVFPPLPQLQFCLLRSVRLHGLQITYRDLAGLLFLKLPNLGCLTSNCRYRSIFDRFCYLCTNKPLLYGRQ